MKSVDSILTTKNAFAASVGVIGGLIAKAIGGWDAVLHLLLMAMVFDYITGIMVAALFKKSRKTKSGALSSSVGWRGLCTKVTTLMCVALCAQMDTAMGTTVIRFWATLGFAANEILSVIENGGLMGIKYPAIMNKALDVMYGRAVMDVKTFGINNDINKDNKGDSK